MTKLVTCHLKLETTRGKLLPHYRYATAQIAQRRIAPVLPPICVISAPRSLTSAATKCQFSGSLPHSRLPFRREICELCNSYNSLLFSRYLYWLSTDD